MLEVVQIPEELLISAVQPIFKKGDRNFCENYRCISLFNVDYKIYAKVIGAILQAIPEVMLLQEKSGIRNGRSCIDNVFTLQQVTGKRRELCLETHIEFVDLVNGLIE